MLDWSILTFLAEPWFVGLWYLTGALGAAWVAYDSFCVNTQVNFALKLAWPIIVFFFSVIGIIAYLATCRPRLPGRGGASNEEHHAYVEATWKKVTGSLIHCVGGDGLGIMTAMVIARLLNFSFWVEFWFEYAVGFAFGWFIFQYIAMRNMGSGPLMALYLGGRAEFFSMITVMLGMGLVMRLVTPNVVGEQPDPTTVAFWGFGALGLLAGAIATIPMNWWLVRIGWKHGMS